MPTDPAALSAAVRALGDLYAEVEAAAGRLSLLHGARLRCRNGCRDCCTDGLTVFEVEAEHLRRQYPALLADSLPHPEGRCAFLDAAGSCRIYAQRPYVCRTQGLPLRWIEESPDGQSVELRDICPLNEAEEPLERLPEESCWTLGPFEGRLAQLQAGCDGGTLRRIPLRRLFAAGPRGQSPDGNALS